MKPVNKRWVLIFSLALNAGFIIMALWGLYEHHLIVPTHLRHTQAIEQSLRDMDMPPQIRRQAKAEYAKFIDQMKQIRAAIKATGHDNFELLGHEGNLDQQAFDQNWSKIEVLWKRKHALVKDHLMTMRRVLGPKYSHLFFNDVEQRTRKQIKQQ